MDEKYIATREELADAVLKKGRPLLMEMNHDGTAVNILRAASAVILTQHQVKDILDYAWATGFNACRIELKFGDMKRG